MKWPTFAALACALVLSSHAPGYADNPIINPSFESGIGYPWTAYSYTPVAPLITGSAAYPTVGTPGSTFNLLPPYTSADGTSVCGMESVANQSKNGGVCQTFSWLSGGGDLSVKVRSFSDKAGGNGCYVRIGIAPGSTTNRLAATQWVTSSAYSSAWQTLTLPVAAGLTTHTVFIESYQPGNTSYKMSTLWDDVRWTPYITIVDTPSKTGMDPAHPDTTARITWTTNLASSSHVEYQSGTGPWQSADDAALVTSHSVLITGLQPASDCTFRVSSSAPDCIGVTSSDYWFKTPIQLTELAATTGDPNVVVTWKTDVATTSWVDYGLDTSYGQTAGDSNLTTDHSVTITGLTDGRTYHYRARSGAPNYTSANSTDKTFATLPASHPALGNASFENLQAGVPNMYPWSFYTYKPDDQQIDGVVGPYPAGGTASWFPAEVGIQAYDGSYFLGGGAHLTYKNGGVYQRISLNTPQTCAFTARFATYQLGGGLNDTRVDIGLDPSGGINPNAATVKWWRGASPTNSKLWYPAGVVADCPAGVVTVFLGTRQLYGLDARAVAIDDATFGQPVVMSIGDLRSRKRCPGVVLQGKIVTCVCPTLTSYEDQSYQKIYIQEPSCPAGIGVLLGPVDPANPPDLPLVSNKITITGALVPLGKEHVVMGYKWTVDHGTYDLPKPLAMKQQSIGGSATNQIALNGDGLCNLGVRVRLFGKITYPDIGIDGDVYIDDGSKLPTSVHDVSTGADVYGALVRLKDKGVIFYKGDYIALNGVLTMENIGSVGWPEYKYVLTMSDLDDWTVLQAAPQ